MKAIRDAQPYLVLARQTDLELLYAPSQIALAALRLASSPLYSSYLQVKYPGLEGQLDREKLEAVVEEIARGIVAEEGRVVDMAKVKDVDRRLRTCTNPEKVPGSALYVYLQSRLR
jgi:cyclin H